MHPLRAFKFSPNEKLPEYRLNNVHTGRTATGRSREGEVVVVLGWVGGLRELHADEGFLRSTSPDLLRYALTEAFTAAQEGPRA